MENENTNIANDEYSPERAPLDKIRDRIRKYPILMFCITIVLAFFVGVTFNSFNTVSNDIYDDLFNAYNKKTTEYDSLQNEYNAYKERMQPYEETQIQDAKNKAEQERIALEEKKAAEEKAAEEKAAKEAEEKRQKEENAKANSLGLTIDEFYTNFNDNAAMNGIDAFLGKATTTNGLTSYLTLNSDTTVKCYTSYGYVSMVMVDVRRTTSESLIKSSYHVINALMTLDPSLSQNKADNILTNLLNGAQATPDEDYSITNKSLKCTAVVSQNLILFTFQKK